MNEDPFGKDQNTCYSMLANGEAGMILNGTWTVTNATAMNPDAEFGIFALPVSETAEDNVMPMCPPESRSSRVWIPPIWKAHLRMPQIL